MAKAFKPSSFTEALASQIMGVSKQPGISMEDAVSQHILRTTRSATDIHLQGDPTRELPPCAICQTFVSNGKSIDCPGLQIAMKTDEAVLKARRSVF